MDQRLARVTLRQLRRAPCFRRFVAASLVVATLSCFATFTAAGQTVGDLVGRVSQANLSAHITALEGDRASVGGAAAAADYIRSQLASYGFTVERAPVGSSENLIAQHTGVTHANQVFIVGAHFDAVPGSPGADDNASGIAGLLEIARIAANERFGSTIQFIAFGLEEAGLQGSTQIAQQYAAAKVNVVGMISLEMIGYTCDFPCQFPFIDALPCLDVSIPGVRSGIYIGVVGNSASTALLSDFSTAAAAEVPGLFVLTAEVLGTGTCFPDSRRSDHAPFWDVGYPALLVTDTANFRNPNYHLATDTAATLDLVFAANVTRASLATLAGQRSRMA